jgi:hypothetical protein
MVTLVGCSDSFSSFILQSLAEGGPLFGAQWPHRLPLAPPHVSFILPPELLLGKVYPSSPLQQQDQVHIMTGLIIAGFHRSGTSLIGQMLASHGLPLGGELIDSNEFNRFGHFEDWPVVQFHDAALHRVGADWSTPLAVQIPFIEDERRWVLDYVRERERAGADWALKDPRMCRFVRQWKELVPRLKFLIIYRSPAECAQSLNRRSNIYMARSGDTDETARGFYSDPDLALNLWIEHNRQLLDLRIAYPEDCMVLGHHHILSGYDLMGSIYTQFGIAPKFTPPETTIHPEAISKKRSSLFCTDPALIKSALELWDEFQQHDFAVAQDWPAKDVRESLAHDPGGHQARAAMRSIQFPELYCKIAEQQGKIAELELKISELENLIEKLRPLARKSSKPPFSLYFMKRTKYRDAIEGILSKRPIS